MSKHSFVELESGEQEYFDSPYQAFKFAKQKEQQHRNSVALVAVSDDFGDTTNMEELLLKMESVTTYRGQQLRYMIRSLDNVTEWLRAQIENAEEEDDED